jgi:RimJ/RimL family protein N-acetyltransferase
MPDAFLVASLRADAAQAEVLIGAEIPPEWFEERALIQRRLDDRRRDPAYAPWAVRAMLAGPAARQPGGTMVGYIGFHTRPDPAYLRPHAPGGVEMGYTVFAPYRRQGYAEEAVRGLMRWAAQYDVERFVVSVAPGNVASTALARKLGFVKVTEQIDDVDGLEYVYVLAGRALAQVLSPE